MVPDVPQVPRRPRRGARDRRRVRARPAAVAEKRAKPVKLAKGSTTLAIGQGAATALESLGIAVAPRKPARAGDAGVAFPITSGKLDATSYAGRIRHAAAFAHRGSTRVDLRNFTIRLTPRRTLPPGVGGSRVSILAHRPVRREGQSRGSKLRSPACARR
jgi:hypothetical protein